MAIEPIYGMYVHDEETDTDGVAKFSSEELEDIRVGADGVTYASAGDAIRTGDQTAVNDGVHKNVPTIAGYYGTNGKLSVRTANNERSTDLFPIDDIDSIVLHNPSNQTIYLWVIYFDENKSGLSRTTVTTSSTSSKYFYHIDKSITGAYVAISYRGYTDVTLDVNLNRDVVDQYIVEKQGKINKQQSAYNDNMWNDTQYIYGTNCSLQNGFGTGKNKVNVTNTNFRLGSVHSPGGSSDYADGDRYPCEENDIIVLKVNNGHFNNNYINYYDENNVSLRIDNSEEKVMVSVAPANSAFFIVRIGGSGTNTPVGDYEIEVEIIKNPTLPGTSYKWLANPNIKSINHRGYNLIAPENTIPAFRLSKKYGFNYVETDIQLTSDGVPVLLHDATINRTGRNADGSAIANTINIYDITLAQAKTYDFGIYKGQKYAGTKISTFEEFCKFCHKAGLNAYVEVKNESPWTTETVANLKSIAIANGMYDHITWIGDNFQSMRIVADTMDNSRIGLVVGAVTDFSRTACTELKRDTNTVFVDCKTISAEQLTNCINDGFPVEMWSVSADPTAMLNAPAYVSGFTHNYLVAGDVLASTSI